MPRSNVLAAQIRELPQLSVALSADRIVLGAVYVEHRINASYLAFGARLLRAVIAAEDKRFFVHCGIDPLAMMRAAWKNVRRGRIVQGGSTITQQLVRNVILRDTRRTFSRKLLEILSALRLEKCVSKPEILEAYLNSAYFGHGMFGVRLASLEIFNKEPIELTDQESAHLAGLLRAPARYCYCCNPASAALRTQRVLGRVARARYLPAVPSTSFPARRWRRRKELTTACPATLPYFLDYVRQWLLSNCRSHFPSRRLIVRTSLSPECQLALEESVAEFRRLGFTGRLLSVIQDAGTGLVRGLAGGSDHAQQPFNAAINGRLQPGSIVKPLILAAAVEAGIALDKTYVSRPLEISLGDGRIWNVHNFQDTYRGSITVAEALVHSDNTVFAQLVLDVGLDRLSIFLKRLGYRAGVTPAIATGAVRIPMSPLEMCASYSLFSSGGFLYASSPVTSVSTEEGAEVHEYRPAVPKPVLDPWIAESIRPLLHDVATRGTGTIPSGLADLHAKTGTTDTGFWYMSFDPSYRVLAWVEKEPSVPTETYVDKGITAKALADRIWKLGSSWK